VAEVPIKSSVWWNRKKVPSATGHEGPEREQICSSPRSLTSALDGGEWLTPRPGRFLSPGKRSCTHSTGVWVGPRARLDACGKSSTHRGSIPGSFSP
jgi:hypothetical protein